MLDPFTGQTIEQTSACYHLTVKSFEVHAVENDQVFEPGEAVIITNILVSNSGDLTLPTGSILTITDNNPAPLVGQPLQNNTIY